MTEKPRKNEEAPGIALRATADESDAASYLGVRVQTGGFQLLRFQLELEGELDAAFIDAVGGEGKRLARWRWRATDENGLQRQFTVVVRPGQDAGPFTAVETGSPGAARTVDVFVQLRPGAEATVGVSRVETLPA